VVAGALPGDEGPAEREEGSGVLGEDRERGEGAGGDDVVGLGAVGVGPLLSSGRYGGGVGNLSGVGEPRYDLAFAACGLDQVDGDGWEGGGEDEAWKAGAGPEVGDLGGLADGLGLEAAEAVRDVDVDGVDGIGDRGGWRRLGGKGSEQRGELVDGRFRELVPGRVGQESFRCGIRQLVAGSQGSDRFA
jgi:hypothetical protein